MASNSAGNSFEFQTDAVELLSWSSQSSWTSNLLSQTVLGIRKLECDLEVPKLSTDKQSNSVLFV